MGSHITSLMFDRFSSHFLSFAIISLILGAILLPSNQSFSQELGYFSFLFALFSFFFLFYIFNEFTFEQGEPQHQETNPHSTSLGNFILVNAIASIVIIFFINRYFLFSNSILPAFSPNLYLTEINPFTLLGGYASSGQGFIVQDLFSIWESFLPLTIEEFERLYFLTFFFFYYFLACTISRVVYRAFQIRGIDESIFSVLFSILFLLNFTYYSVGYGSFIIGSLMFTYVIAKFFEAIKFDRFEFNDALKVGLAISFGMFGDPRLLVYYLLLIFGLLLGQALKKNLWNLFKFSAKTFSLIIPLFGVYYLMTSFTSNFQPNGSRIGNIQTIAFFSSSTKPMFIWTFLTNWWSGFVAAPPSILGYSANRLNFLPTLYGGNAIAVVPPSSIDAIWTFSLSLVSVLALASLYFVRHDTQNRRLIYFFLPFFLMFAITLGTNLQFEPFVYAVAYISQLPLIGPLWAVTVSTPPWIAAYFSSFLIIFACYSVLSVTELIRRGHMGNVQRVSNVHPKSKHLLGRNHYLLSRNAFVFVVLAIFLFANWQILFVTNALGQELPGELPGNQVSSTTYMTPVNPPPGWLKAYQSLFSTSNEDYSVFTNDGSLIPYTWDNGSSAFSQPGIQPNPEFGTLLMQLLQNNESYLIPTLMNLYGVKYFFFDKSQLHPDWEMYRELSDSGLTIVKTSPYFTVFRDQNASELYQSPFSISLNNESAANILDMLYLLNSRNLTPAVVNNKFPSTISFNNSLQNGSDAHGLFYPSSIIASEFPSGAVEGFPGNFSGSSNADNFFIGDGWGITRFNGGFYVNYSLSNNSLCIHKYDGNTGKSPDSIISVHYGDTYLPGYFFPGILVPENGSDGVFIHYEFTYSASEGSGSLTFGAGDLSNSLFLGVKNRTISGIYNLPGGSRLFSFGFGLSGGYNGSLIVRNFSLTYTFLRNGLVNINGSLSKNISASPSTAYAVLYSGGANSSTIGPHMVIENSNPSGFLHLNITGIKLLNSIAVLQRIFVISDSSSNVLYTFSQQGSVISFNTLHDAKFLVVSYNPSYRWDTNKNLRYVGVNPLGQEIFMVLSNGKGTIFIPQTYPFLVLDVATAVAVNVIIPIVLFTKLPKRARKIALRVIYRTGVVIQNLLLDSP